MFIIESVDDFNRIAKEFSVVFFNMPPYENKKKIISKLESVVKPINIYSKNESYFIELYTWDFYNSDIEFWRFEISNNSLKIDESKIVLENIGPLGRNLQVGKPEDY